MSNGLLAVVILAAAAVGALLPLIVLLTLAASRAGREISEMGAQLKRTLAQVEVVSDRVELLSRGLKGGETSIAELLATVGNLSRSLDRNMGNIGVITTLVASAGGALATYFGARPPGEEATQAPEPDKDEASPEGRASPAASARPAADSH